jgi:heme oxygenase (biliverdin-IX-beta and delta-forming)
LSAVSALRSATGPAHDAVDQLYGRFDLSDRTSYTAFLTAHARALPAVEDALAGAAVPPWRPRRALLAADLSDLGTHVPSALPFAAPADTAAAWGMLYVIEGSRLGGAMLARQVGEGLPARYLAARHQSGEWRALLAGIDAAADDDAWVARAVAAARATFDLYGRAAA